MCSIYCWRIIFWVIAMVVVLLYTIFAPEAFFHNTYRKENPKLFDRWRDKRLAWNIHQSFMHFIGSTLGFVALYFLVFKLGISDPSKFSFIHLILFLIGISGIMGFIPKILFGSTIGKS